MILVNTHSFFAASTNQPDLVDVILENCFPTNRERLYALLRCNSYGDNVLHYCAAGNLVDCYKHIVESAMKLVGINPENGFTAMAENKEYHLLNRTFANKINFDGRSPFTLAAEYGHVEIFECILQTWRLTQWEYGPVSKHLYDIVGFDYDYPSDYVELIPGADEENDSLDDEYDQDGFKISHGDGSRAVMLWVKYFKEIDAVNRNELIKVKTNQPDKSNDIVTAEKESDDTGTSKVSQSAEKLSYSSSFKAPGLDRKGSIKIHRQSEVKTNGDVESDIFVPTALCIITKMRHVCLIENPTVEYYVKQKWKHWGRGVFFSNFYLNLVSFALYVAFIIARAWYMKLDDGSALEYRVRVLAFFLYVAVISLEVRSVVKELVMWRYYGYSFHYLQMMQGSARVFTFLKLAYDTLMILGAFVTWTQLSPAAEVLFYAGSGVLQGAVTMWYLLGYEGTGKLMMSIIEIFVHDLGPFATIHGIATLGFTTAFFVLSPNTYLIDTSTNDDVETTASETYGEIKQPMFMFAQRFAEIVSDSFNPGHPTYFAYPDASIQWLAQLLCFLFIFSVPTLMINLLIAIMNDRYSEVQKSSDARWLLEISSIMSRFEMEVLSIADLSSDPNNPTRKRIDEEVAEFALFTVLVGSNDHNYIEIENVDTDWKVTRGKRRNL